MKVHVSLSHLVIATVITACLLGTSKFAIAEIFVATQTVDPWPDQSIPSSDLETVELIFDVPTLASSDALITLSVVGDFNGLDEFIDADADTFDLGRLFDGNDANDVFDFNGDDPGDAILFNTITVNGIIPQNLFNGLIADGILQLTLAPTEAQQAPQGVNASVTATVSFESIPEPTTSITLALLALTAVSRRKTRKRGRSSLSAGQFRQ